MSKALVIAALLFAGLGWHGFAAAQPKAEAAAEPPPMPQQLYKYKTKGGRTAYTNILDEVPPEQRADYKVDLSHVTLNTSIGNDLNKRLEVEHKELAASPYCKQLEQAAAKTELQQLWDDHAVTIVCGGLIALLILITPTMMRSVHPPEWARVLTKVIPTLFLIGGAMYGMQMANKKVLETRQRLKPCLSETFASLDRSQNPAADRISLIEQLKRDVARWQNAAAERNQLLDELANER